MNFSTHLSSNAPFTGPSFELGSAYHFPMNAEVGDVAGDKAPWKAALAHRLRMVAQLKRGWDGPRSQAIEPAVAYIVQGLLEHAFESLHNPVLPFIVPMADGGLQVEWHRKATDLEVAFFADGTVSGLLQDRANLIEDEAEGDAAIGMLLRHSRRLASAGDDVAAVARTKEAGPFRIAA